MSEATDQVVRLYDAIERRDLDGVMAVMHPRVAFQDFLDGGDLVGLDAVRTFYERLFAMPIQLDPITVEDLSDGRVLVDMQASVRDQSGRLWSDSRSQATYHFRDGLVIGVTLPPTRLDP